MKSLIITGCCILLIVSSSAQTENKRSKTVFSAIKNNRPQDLPFLLTSKSIRNVEVDEKPVLFYALEERASFEIIETLLKIAGNNVDFVNYPRTFAGNLYLYKLPLTVACINGDTNIVNLLIDAGAYFLPPILTPKQQRNDSKQLWQRFGKNQDVRVLIKRRMPDFPDPEGELTDVVKEIEKDMVYVEGGSFKMGCEGQKRECGRAWPQVELRVESFYISTFEVTQKQWETLIGTNPSFNKNCSQCPVENVSWNDVQNFIKKLNALSSKKFRLPTEKEWEFAAKGGTKRSAYLFAGSNDLNLVSWNNKNCSRPQPVAKKAPNELGLYDMSGNVFEWGSSFFSDDLLIYKEQPEGPQTGNERVNKGGSWKTDYFYSQPQNRSKLYADMAADDTGFRLASDN